MNGFIMSAMCAAIISFILRMLSVGKNFEKHISFVAGMVVLVTLMSSFATIDFEKIEQIIGDIQVESQSFDTQRYYNERVSEKFEDELCKQVVECVNNAGYGECEVEVMVEKNIDGEVSFVSGIYIKMYEVYDNEHIREIVASEFGFSQEIIHVGGVGE